MLFIGSRVVNPEPDLNSVRAGSLVSCGRDKGIVVRALELKDAFLPLTIEVYTQYDH